MAGFWITNRVANPVLRRLLRTPAGRVLGRRLAVLRYTGRRTGEPHELICGYVRDGATVWVRVGMPERKVWWHNLRTPADVELWLAGEHVRARAVVVEGAQSPDDPATRAVLVRADLTGFPDRPAP
ncbi:MAG: nitroreductase/quinone reductase family protein [Blastococcus sp.]